MGEHVARATCRSSCAPQWKLLILWELWLGGRDSNPDTVVQSHVSYRWTTSQCGNRDGMETLIIVREQPFAHLRAADERQDVEQPGAHRGSGDGDADGVNERPGLETARLGELTQCGLG